MGLNLSDEDYHKVQSDDWNPEVKVDINLRNPKGEATEITIVNHVLGLSPYVLIQPTVDADTITFAVSGSEFELDDLRNVCASIMAAIDQHTGAPSAADVLKDVLTTEERKLWLDPDDASEIITEFEDRFDG